MMSWLRPHWKAWGGGSGDKEAEHPGLWRWEKHKGLGSQVSEVEKRKRAGEAGSRGGKQPRAGQKRTSQTSGTGGWQANGPSSVPFQALLSMVHVAQGHGHTKTGCSWPQTSSLPKRAATPPGLAMTYLKHWRW